MISVPASTTHIGAHPSSRTQTPFRAVFPFQTRFSGNASRQFPFLYGTFTVAPKETRAKFFKRDDWDLRISKHLQVGLSLAITMGQWVCLHLFLAPLVTGSLGDYLGCARIWFAYKRRVREGYILFKLTELSNNRRDTRILLL